MSNEGLRKVVDEFRKEEKPKRRRKVNRTLSLDQEYFEEIQVRCKKRGKAVSEIFDKLMYVFLTELDSSDEDIDQPA